MGWALDVDDSEGVLTGPQRRLALAAARAVFLRLRTDPFEAAVAVLARNEVLAGCSQFESETAARAMVWREAAALVHEICGMGAFLYLRQEHVLVPASGIPVRKFA
jgi:methenyltetrahydromethanopterin cyclohydrolase